MKNAKKQRKSRPTKKTPARRRTPQESTRPPQVQSRKVATSGQKKPVVKRGRRSKSKHVQPTKRKVAQVLARMRKVGTSLRKASREAKVSPKTVLKTAPSALKKNKSRRYTANPSDRLIRVLMIPTPGGREEVSIRGFSAASLLGSYWSALHLYYETGDDSVLQKFRGKSVTAVGGKKYPLLTDLEILNRLGSAGEVSFESLYSRSE